MHSLFPPGKPLPYFEYLPGLPKAVIHDKVITRLN